MNFFKQENMKNENKNFPEIVLSLPPFLFSSPSGFPVKPGCFANPLRRTRTTNAHRRPEVDG
jgi:hypothetical protein